MLSQTCILTEHPLHTELLPFPKEDLLFFDIETTGFQAASCRLYLIGVLFFSDGTWQSLQWLSESPKEEQELLQTFFALCTDDTVLVHFNGDGFDLPFLAQKAKRYGTAVPAVRQSIDLYRIMRPYREKLGLSHMNQKALETFLKIERKDRLSGGELIDVYRHFCASPSPNEQELLFLHNLDDLKGMADLLPLLAFPALFEHHAFSLRQASWEDSIAGAPSLLVDLTLRHALPSALSVPASYGSLQAEGDSCRLLIHAYEGELKYFFPDYHNYYYVAEQDCALHKSVAVYLDPSRRIPATAASCYQRRSGLFLPQLTGRITPVFYETYRGKKLWFACTQSFMNTPGAFLEYIKSLISV